MGGEGSGRPQENYTACDLLINEGDFKSIVVTKAVDEYVTVVDFLMATIKGEASDVVVTPKGDIIRRPPSLEVRVKAAKVWKEMTLDKVISDKKMIAMPENQANLFGDFMDAIHEIEKKMDGKIIPIGGN